MPEEKKLSDHINYESIFDLKLSVEQYTEKLEELLKEAHVGVVERKSIIRQKVQEFREKIRTKDVRKR